MKPAHKAKTEVLFYFLLVAMVGGFSIYFLPFTVFDGFATFSNDAASYVLTGRRWSLFFEPTHAEVFTSPVHPYPPAFAWLLALTGASESLWAGHLVVSLCLLASLFLIGHYIAQQTDKLTAGVVTAAIILIPGIIINSFGILSENPYLLVSLAALSVYLHIRNQHDVSWLFYLLLLALLAATVLTRTVGIALIAAFLVVPIFDRTLVTRHRITLPLVALGSIITWRVCKALIPAETGLSYGFYVSVILDSSPNGIVDLIVPLWNSVNLNMVKLLGSWSQYFAINSSAGISFAFSYFFVIASVVGLVLRAVRMRLDAIYVLFYVAIILLWPVSEQMTRFLHPIAALLLIQPVILLSERGYLKAKSRISYAVVMAGCVLIAHSLVVHAGLLDSKRRVDSEFPSLAHSPEYYLATPDNDGVGLAKSYASVAALMVSSVERIPRDAIVAAVKHENYALLADRKAVALSGRVGMNQQFCNLKLGRVDYVLITNLVSTLNPLGLTLIDRYEPITADTWARTGADQISVAYVLKIDQAALDATLDASELVCEEIRLVR
jgi:hypothetical protein